jgi:hypothetical protein
MKHPLYTLLAITVAVIVGLFAYTRSSNHGDPARDLIDRQTPEPKY